MYYDYFANPSVGADAGFADHFLHGLMGFDHLLASVLVVALSVVRYRQEFWLPAATFLVTMGLGFIVGALGVSLPGHILWGIAVFSGVAALLPFWLPCPFCGYWALVGLAGLTFGLAHSPPGVSPEPFQVVAGLGMTLGNLLNLLPVLYLGMRFTRPGRLAAKRSEIIREAKQPSLVDVALSKEREKRRAVG